MLRNHYLTWPFLSILEPLEPRYFLSASVLDDAAPADPGLPTITALTSADSTDAAALSPNHLRQLAGPEELRSYLIDYFRQHPSYYRWYGWYEDFGGDVALNSPSSSHSDTNTQVQGIDEADQVETDGRYLYIARAGRITIVDAESPEKAGVALISIEGTNPQIYLSGNSLTVITTHYDRPWISLGEGVTAYWCCRPYRSEPKTMVSVYDVADPSDPSLVSTTTIDGSVASSRAVDGRVYLVMRHTISGPRYPWYSFPIFVLDKSVPLNDLAAMPPFKYDKPDVDFDEGFLDEQLPTYTTTFADESNITGSLIDSDKLYAPDGDASSGSLYSIVTIDTTADQPTVIDKLAVAGEVEQVYMAADAIYLTSTSYTMGFADQTTNIQKFSVTDQGVKYAASGQVQGRLLNSFSMDEYNGDFRIAITYTEPTTEGGWLWNNSASGIFVLRQQGEGFETVGSITGLGRTEQIYSARFIGDRAYLVTFRRTDPLFCIDLSDPTQPTLAGELEMPGYSSYLQPVGDHLLLGIGRISGDEGGWGLNAVKVSLYNVADPANPVVVSDLIFDADWWSSSAAEYDHHAFNYSPELGVLAIPVATGKQTRMELIRVDPTDGLTNLGAIKQKSWAERGVFIGSLVYSIGSREIVIASVDDPEQALATVEIALPGDPPDWRWPIIDDPIIIIDDPIIDPDPVDPDPGTDPNDPTEEPVDAEEPNVTDDPVPTDEPAETEQPADSDDPDLYLDQSPEDIFADEPPIAEWADDLLGDNEDLFGQAEDVLWE